MKDIFGKSNISFNILKTLFILIVATLLSIVFYNMNFFDSNLILVYVLAVVCISVATNHFLYSICGSISSVLIFNFFFTEPKYSFFANNSSYYMTFLVMLFTAIIIGMLATKLNLQIQITTSNAKKLQILLETSQLLSKAVEINEIGDITVYQINKLLNRDVKVYIINGDDVFDDVVISVINEKIFKEVNDNLYMPIMSKHGIYGVLEIPMLNQSFTNFEKDTILSILNECAISLENYYNNIEKENAKITAKNEQLRANLLRSISHDLRTPLTSISGNATNLLMNGDKIDEETKMQIYEDINNESIWLIGLMENLLQATKFEDGKMRLNKSFEIIGDILDDAMSHVDKKFIDHNIKITNNCECDVINVDAKLISQVFVNIINNAIKYTPVGSDINININRVENSINISISDNGPGIKEEDKEKVFEKFYCCHNNLYDTRRSLGLGLFLCKSIIIAHGGELTVKDNIPTGAKFIFTIPIKEGLNDEK